MLHFSKWKIKHETKKEEKKKLVKKRRKSTKMNWKVNGKKICEWKKEKIWHRIEASLYSYSFIVFVESNLSSSVKPLLRIYVYCNIQDNFSSVLPRNRLYAIMLYSCCKEKKNGI